jgi:hypothetical protein
MYLYQWRADSQGRFDAGLIRPDGSSRPALDVVRTQLAAMAGASRASGASPSASGAPGLPRALPGPVTVRASGASDVQLRCPPGVSGGCVGRLWVEDVALRTVTLVNGRAPGYVLRPVARAFAVAPGRGSRVRFSVTRSVLVRAWSRRQLRLRLMIASPEEPFALRARWRVDAWRPANGLSPRRRAR